MPIAKASLKLPWSLDKPYWSGIRISATVVCEELPMYRGEADFMQASSNKMAAHSKMERSVWRRLPRVRPQRRMLLPLIFSTTYMFLGTQKNGYKMHTRSNLKMWSWLLLKDKQAPLLLFVFFLLYERGFLQKEVSSRFFAMSFWCFFGSRHWIMSRVAMSGSQLCSLICVR